MLATPPPLRRLVEQAAELDLRDVPERTRRHGVGVIADTVGVMLAGGLTEEIAALARADERDPFSRRGAGDSQLVVAGQPGADPLTAAFVNASAGTFLELDEGVRPSGHPGVHVIPAALAAAQALHSSGGELLCAVLAGYEVAARLFTAYRLRYPTHPHGNLATVGAAVAVARLRGGDPVSCAKIATALPLLSVWQPCFEGATVRNVFAGVGAATGVLSCTLAMAGFTGSDEALPAAFGQIAGELVDEAQLERPIVAEDLMIDHDYQKRHSACALSHSAIDALLSLGPIDPEQVKEVRVLTVENNLRLDRQARGNDLSNRFSIQYALAAAIVHGHALPAAFLTTPQAAAVARLISVSASPEMTARWPAESPARVEVELLGRTLTAEVGNPAGHETRRLSADQLRSKFEALAADPETGRPRACYDRLLSLESIDDVSGLLDARQ